MLVELFSIYIRNDEGSPYWDTGDVFKIYYDTGTEEITPYHNGVLYSGSIYETIGVYGDDWFAIGVSDGNYLKSNYSFCDGADLVEFRMVKNRPTLDAIAEKVVTSNSPTCQTGSGAPVCDIHFSGTPKIVNATSVTNDDGEVTVAAVSSNGAIQYALHDLTYVSDGQASGHFTGLAPGPYSIWAKDDAGCIAKIDLTVLYQPASSERLSFQWRDIDETRTSGIKIYDREYIGDVVIAEKADSSPFYLNKPKPSAGDINDKFYPIHPTNADLNFKSIVDFEFLNLYTHDNKRFKVVYGIIDAGSFVPQWTGFILPSTYGEAFITPPYTSTISLTDNVESLKDTPFEDEEGNLISGKISLIQVIALIMKKTGLELEIQSGINIYEQDMATGAGDDPLAQTYINTVCYRTKKTIDSAAGSSVEVEEAFNCWDVLADMLTPFGARIFQYNNRWIIEEIDRAGSNYNYRLFDSDGIYEANGAFDSPVDKAADGFRFMDQNQSMEMIPAYGKITVTSKLNYVGSVIHGSFEEADLLSGGNNKNFNGWAFRLNGVKGASFERRDVTQGDGNKRSVGAFDFDVNGVDGNVRDCYIESAVLPFQYGPGDNIKLSFDYLHQSMPPDFPFMVVRFRLKIGANYLQQDGTWDAAAYDYRLYPKPSNDFQSFSQFFNLPDVSILTDTTIQLRIYYYSRYYYDIGVPGDAAENTAAYKNAIRAIATAGIDSDYYFDIYYKDTAFDPASQVVRAFYALYLGNGTEAEDDLQLLLPDDYGPGNYKFWWKVAQRNDTNQNRTRGTTAFYIDNVVLDFFPGGENPPENEDVALNVSKYINEEKTVELYNFDVPSDIDNAKNMYNNYFMHSDGTPTVYWTRSGINELLPIQQILLKVLGGNYSAPTFKISGSIYSPLFRIGMNNYLRVTKKGSGMTVTNPDFDADLSYWTQASAGEDFTWAADNGGSAQVVLSGAQDSRMIYQNVSHKGGYIQLSVNVNVAAVTGEREDNMHVLMWRNGKLVHTERIRTFLNHEGDYAFIYTAFAPSNIDRIGFIFKYVNGAGDVTYNVGEFLPAGVNILEVYQISNYSFNERFNKYELELMQQSKSYISLVGIDTGGVGQAGEGDGQFSGAYSSAYGGDFDVIRS